MIFLKGEVVMKAKEVNSIRWFEMTGWKRDLMSIGVAFIMVILAAVLLAAFIMLVIFAIG